MRVQEVQGYSARCEAKGVERVVSLLLLKPEEVQVGDYVVVHLGHAMHTVTPEEAQAAWTLYDQILAAEQG